MRLSDVAQIGALKVVRDGEFRSLGLLSHRQEAMLVQFYDHKFAPAVSGNPNITCVITTQELSAKISRDLAIAVCSEPSASFYRVHEYLLRETSFYGVDFDTEIAPTAVIHPTAYVASRNVRIGARTVVEPKAVILDKCVIGDDVVIRAGTVIGGEGCEPKWVSGRHMIVPHAGGVRIGDRVEIQGNAHVARSLFGGFTEIGNDTKVDGMAHVAHNVRIGQGCEIGACTMIAGSTTIGDRVCLGPNSSISSELSIGDGANVTLGAVVTRDVQPGQKVTGHFAVDHRKFLAFMWALTKGEFGKS